MNILHFLICSNNFILLNLYLLGFVIKLREKKRLKRDLNKNIWDKVKTLPYPLFFN